MAKDDYSKAAKDRCLAFNGLKSLSNNYYVSIVHLGGITVECALKAYLQKNNLNYDYGHNLNKLFLAINNGTALGKNEKKHVKKLYYPKSTSSYISLRYQGDSFLNNDEFQAWETAYTTIKKYLYNNYRINI